MGHSPSFPCSRRLATMVGRSSRRAPSSPRRPRARPQLEWLEDRSLFAVNALGASADALLVTTIDGQHLRVKLDAAASLDDALAAYRSRSDVASAEADWTVTTSVIPNDTRFAEMYGLNNTGQSGGTPDADID